MKPSSRTSTVRATLVACITVVMLGAVLAAPANAQGSARTEKSSTSARVYPKKCYSVKSAGETQSHTECYRLIKRLSRHYRVGYRDSLVNKTNREATLECEASQSKTFTWGASVTIGASIKAGIFASIDASVSAEFQKSMTSGTSVKGSVGVPAHTTTYCDRVVYNERFQVRRCLTYSAGTSCKLVVFYAPARRGWVLTDHPN